MAQAAQQLQRAVERGIPANKTRHGEKHQAHKQTAAIARNKAYGALVARKYLDDVGGSDKQYQAKAALVSQREEIDRQAAWRGGGEINQASGVEAAKIKAISILAAGGKRRKAASGIENDVMTAAKNNQAWRSISVASTAAAAAGNNRNQSGQASEENGGEKSKAWHQKNKAKAKISASAAQISISGGSIYHQINIKMWRNRKHHQRSSISAATAISESGGGISNGVSKINQ